MFYMTFENNLGKIEIGGRGKYKLAALEVAGLGLTPKDYKVSEYVGFDGQFTKKGRALSRAITMKFDLKFNDLTYATKYLLRVLSKGGILKTYFGDTHRKITINQITCGDFEDIRILRTFTVQMICDNPYFTDFEPIKENCFETIKNLKYTTAWNLTTKTIWGEINNNKVIVNRGDVKLEPIFYISNITSGRPSVRSAEIGFEILNKTTNQRLKLDYTTQNNEIITINLNIRNPKGRRYIESSILGDITNRHSDDTSLSDFWFEVGNNQIIVNNYNLSENISCFSEYENQYIEGVY